MWLSSGSLHNLSLVNKWGMGTHYGRAWPGLWSQCAINLLIPSTVSLGHLRAVGFAVVWMLLASRPTQTFIHLILIVCYWRIVAAQRRVLMVFGDTPRPWTAIYRHDSVAIELPDDLSGLDHWEGCGSEGRVESSFLLQRPTKRRHAEQHHPLNMQPGEMQSTVW